MDEITPEDFFVGCPDGLAVYRRVRDLLAKATTDLTVHAAKSQVGFRGGRRGFAYIWRPGQYLRNPAADVVLSIALPRQVSSARFKEVVHPAPTVWMHHLEVHSIDEVDDEVEAWLREAAGAAAGARRRATDRP